MPTAGLIPVVTEYIRSLFRHHLELTHILNEFLVDMLIRCVLYCTASLCVISMSFCSCCCIIIIFIIIIIIVIIIIIIVIVVIFIVMIIIINIYES